MTTNHAVTIDGVSKRYGRFLAVDDLNLEVPSGTIYGFLGPNGSGKSTTLRMIMRILLPDTGTITVLGRSALQSSDDRVGYLPEERGLYKKMRVGELLQFHASLKGCRLDRRELVPWLERFALDDWIDKRVEELSKGMAQKVQFLAAIVFRPELVILDEPFSGLDPINADAFSQAVLELKQRGTTVIFSTHDMATAEQMCDALLMIYRGQKVLDGTLEQIQRTYGDDTLRIRIRPRSESLSVSLEALPGVVEVRDFGQSQELQLTPDASQDTLIRELLARGELLQFERIHPTLRDIFLRIAGPEAMRPNAPESEILENEEATAHA